MKNYFFKRSTKVCVLILFFYTACAPYVANTEYKVPLLPKKGLSIGVILDKAPQDIPEEKRPTMELIDNFKKQLKRQIEMKNIFMGVLTGHNRPDYELTGLITHYDGRAGGGSIYAIGGIFVPGPDGLVAVKITTSLTLKNTKTGKVILSKTITKRASDGFNADKSFQMIAKDFAKSLEKTLKKNGYAESG